MIYNLINDDGIGYEIQYKVAEHTHLQISQPSDPGASQTSVLPDQVHHLSVDVRAGDGGQVTSREMILAEELQRNREEVKVG